MFVTDNMKIMKMNSDLDLNLNPNTKAMIIEDLIISRIFKTLAIPYSKGKQFVLSQVLCFIVFLLKV